MIQRKNILSISDTNLKIQIDPLRKFESGIKSKETLIAYKKTFREFLNAITEFNGTFEQKISQFVGFANKNPTETQDLIERYAIYLKDRTKNPRDSSEYLNPSVVPNKFKGLKKFCRINKIHISWEDIENYYPDKNNIKQTRGFTTDEIKQILDHSTGVQMDFVILTMSSSGIRVGGWNGIKWGHINPIYEGNGKYAHSSEHLMNPKIVCASMVVYAGTSDEYVTLISIEAYEKLQSLHKQWVKMMGQEPTNEDLILITKTDNIPFTQSGIRNKISNLVRKSSLFDHVKKERRYDVPYTHGFRKRYNKIMSEMQNKNESHANYIRKERLLGHKSALSKLEGNYFYSDVIESVPQYLEAMPELMITDEYRMKWELEIQRNANVKLEKTVNINQQLFNEMSELKAKITRMGRYIQK